MKETKTQEVLTLFLPFEASRDFVREIRQTLQKRIPGLVLDIKLDPSIVGGAALVYKNQFKDYSLKESMVQNRAKIAQKFKTFV